MHRHGDTTDVQRLYCTASMYVCARLHSSSMLHCSLGMKMVTLVSCGRTWGITHVLAFNPDKAPCGVQSCAHKHTDDTRCPTGAKLALLG